MSQKTITRAYLANKIYQEVGLPQSECSKLLVAVLDQITDALINGSDVKISNFGSFSIRHKNERIGRNPLTGEEAVISERKIIKFKASKELKIQVASLAVPFL